MSTNANREDDKPKLEKFSGEDPSGYRKWKRKAELMLLALPTNFEKSRWGPKLCEYVVGEAEELIEHLSVEELCEDDGYKKILKALDEKYLERKQDELQRFLTEYFFTEM